MQSDQHDDRDPQRGAAVLDPSKLGESADSDGRPGAEYPPDEPIAVDDPSIVAGGMIARDDVETRDRRLEPDRQ